MIENMKPIFSFQAGQAPLLLSVPHSGTYLPSDISERLKPSALNIQDTDWYVDRLYGWAKDLGVSMLVANYSRFVIDLNRSPENAALYSGHGTGLVPTQCFDGTEIYQQGMLPNAEEEHARIEQFWRPYHDQLRSALDETRDKFGYAILLDAHSIRSVVPTLFDGKLPDLNLGTYRGASADPKLISAAYSVLESNHAYTSILDGRFQGGYITRHYGQPEKHIHALQLEMAQSVYMTEQPPVYQAELAAKLAIVLRELITTLIDWSPS
jgi:N-formylglutamate deformylase